MIPDAAVEAAAKVTFEGLFDLDDSDGWEYLTPTEREPYERQARLALEAAAPHMLAEAWDVGAEAQAKCYGMDKDTGPNPYRSTA